MTVSEQCRAPGGPPRSTRSHSIVRRRLAGSGRLVMLLAVVASMATVSAVQAPDYDRTAVSRFSDMRLLHEHAVRHQRVDVRLELTRD